MILPPFNLHQPSTLAEALELADVVGPAARFLAGGSDLLVRMKMGATRADDLISTSAIKEIQHMDGLEIGGGVSLNFLAKSAVIKSRFSALSEAAESVGTAQVRNKGTLAGNICQETHCVYYNRSNRLAGLKPTCFKRGGGECLAVPGAKRCYAAYQGDTAAALLALGAEVRLRRKGNSRRISLYDLFNDDGDRHMNLLPGELLTHVILPEIVPESRSGYLKFRLRAGIDFPLAGVALHLVPASPEAPAGRVRVGLTGLSSRPLLVILDGEVSPGELGEAVRRAVRPVNNVGAKAGHRRHMAVQLAMDLMEKLKNEASDQA